jgi:ABC-2 type transport system ATP-binding protein
MKSTAISVSHLHKTFKLPHERNSGLKQAIVTFHKRRHGYESQHVLKGINFEVKQGEFFGIVGRNGSGKSTLLKLLAGVYVPDGGTIQVTGSLTPFIELGVGFNPELTGRENVFLNGALLGFNHRQMEEMYDDIVEFAEIGRFMNQKLKNYSSGMQVRLAFSIAIRARSDILLIDEVLAVSDAIFRKSATIFASSKEGRTVVFISHDILRSKYCDRGILINNGEIVVSGDRAGHQYLYQPTQPSRRDHSHCAGRDMNRWGGDIRSNRSGDEGRRSATPSLPMTILGRSPLNTRPQSVESLLELRFDSTGMRVLPNTLNPLETASVLPVTA